MSLSVTILGCGSSGGVPRVGSGWGACDPTNPKNRRRRCSILAERIGPAGRTSVLVDTSPDLREQLLDADVRRLDAVLFTHQHVDHETRDLLFQRFGYCFETPAGGMYPPILQAHLMAVDEMVSIDGPGGHLEALPFLMEHGDINALGFRFGSLAYAPDVSRMPEASIERLRGLDILILDALRDTPHPTHFSVSEALALIEIVRPKRAVLTNLHTDLDYDELAARLPPGVEPAYDGMVLELLDDRLV
jgi:phosphoribosyl 1,2-cyclic phosphate phosphodiesterase